LLNDDSNTGALHRGARRCIVVHGALFPERADN